LKTFAELGLKEQILNAITEIGYEQPTPVQAAVIPVLLGEENTDDTADGATVPTQDIIALAQTGTGKTAAYGLPVLQNVDADDRSTQVVILSPTRELCLQIADDLKDYSRYIDGLHVVAVYGGAGIESQIRQLRKGCQIIVATPGRLIDLIHRGAARLEAVRHVVLDEADEMLNMGFTESIDEILSAIPSEHQTLLFSATMGPDIERIAKNYLRQYREIVVGSRNEGAEHVNHIYYAVRAQDKYAALKRIVDYYPRIYAIIFCRTRLETQEVADHLIRDGYSAEALHGDLAQAQRDLTMQKFRTHRTQLLVATDVAARGLDVNELTHVINYGLPDDVENYTHRSGRTGRAGKRGTSISIIHLREKGKVRVIERVIGKKFEVGTLPEPKEICTKQLYKVIDNLEHTEPDEEQIAPFLPEVMHKLEWLTKEELVKRLVQQEFGRFLTYYADAPEIVQPTAREEREEKGNKRDRRDDKRARNAKGNPVAEEGYTRLFLNFGKRDNFFAREIINLVNRYVKGKVEIGRIDLLNNCSFFEVPEEQAELVMGKMAKAKVGERRVVVDFADRADGKADSGAHGPKGRARHNEDRYADSRKKSKPKARKNAERREQNDKEQRFGKDDWKQFFD
jgi:ATP-dependent RNA helicase, DEAD/DEAH box family